MMLIIYINASKFFTRQEHRKHFETL